MTFPEVERIIYDNNPLDRVICQIRFPPILRIESELPTNFQEQIRRDFPEYEEKLDHQLKLHGVLNTINDDMAELIERSKSKRYDTQKIRINLVKTSWETC